MMAVFGVLCVLCVQVVRSVIASDSTLMIVNSQFGKIQGEIVQRENADESYVLFSNIPFAKPPVGELRFAKPEPHPKIDGVFDATSKRTVKCLHPEEFLMGYDQGSEDCLILNVFAKNVKPVNKLKKVMVFIHGGGFVAGWSSMYNMSSFVSTHDVIGVTINYRLGILGFLSTGNEASPGNYGLWDQAMALQWVKDNIKAFGGDPDDVTISGESAGGASVAYQTLSPVTKGLFSKACPQSGAATSVFGQALKVQEHTVMMAKHANCWEGEVVDQINLEQSQHIIKCLREVDTSVFTSYVYYTVLEGRFVPSVDGDFVPRKPSLLLQDESYLESIGFFDRSYLVSIVNNEYAIMKTFYDNVNEAILSNDKMTEEEKKDAVTKYGKDVKDYHLHVNLDTDASNSELVENIDSFYNRRNLGDDAILDMVTDHAFLIPSYEFLNAASKQRKSKLWFLFFNYFPGFMKGKYKGTVHAADLLYWHDLCPEEMDKQLHMNMQGELDDGDLRLKSLFSSLLVEFMKSGDPNPALTEHLHSRWPEYDPENSHYLNFNLEPTVRSHLEREKRDLWLKTVPNWRKKTYQHTEL